jgi:hypothetical protein
VIGSLIIAAGFGARIVLTGHLWEIIVCTTIAGAGTGIAYAAMPGLIIHAAPPSWPPTGSTRCSVASAAPWRARSAAASWPPRPSWVA